MTDARLDQIRARLARQAQMGAEYIDDALFPSSDVRYLLRLLDREGDVAERIDKEWRRGGTGDPHGLFRGYEIVRGRALEESILKCPDLWVDEATP